MSETLKPSDENNEWQTHDSHHFYEPAQTFPGDESVEVPYHEAIDYDPKKKNYARRSVAGILRVAQRFGAQIDLETYERTRRVITSPEAVDVYIDSGAPEEREQRFDLMAGSISDAFAALNTTDCLNRLDDEDRMSGALVRYWGNSVQNLSEETRSNIRQHALNVLNFSLLKAKARSLPDYMDNMSEEARTYAQLWVDTVWAGQTSNKLANREGFEKWTINGMLVVTLFDSAIDLRNDFDEGNVQFKPTIRGRVLLGRKALGYAPSVIGPMALWKLQSLNKSLRTQIKA